jgi:hypothetical protein
VFEVVYVDGRADEQVRADWVERQGRFVALMTTCVVVNRPRDVVALRVPISELRALRRISG